MAPSTPHPDSTPPGFADLHSVFREASSWDELTQKLADRSVSIQDHGGGSLALRSPDSQLPWPSDIPAAELARRFGEPYAEYALREATPKSIVQGFETLSKAQSWTDAQQALEALGLELWSNPPHLVSEALAVPIPQDLLTQLETRWRHPYHEWRQGLSPRPDPSRLHRHIEQATSWRDLASRLDSERIHLDFQSFTGRIIAYDEHARRVELPATLDISTLESQFGEPFRMAELDASQLELLKSAVREAESWPDLAQGLRDMGLHMDPDFHHNDLVLKDGLTQLPVYRGDGPWPIPALSDLEERLGAFGPWADAVASVEQAALRAGISTELRQRLEVEHSRAAGLTRHLESRLSRHQRLRDELLNSQAAYRGHLSEAFRSAEIPRVEKALVAHLGDHGYQATANALTRRPHKFGPLLGRGGPFPNARRRQARAAAQSAARRLLGLHALRLRISALPDPPDQAAIHNARNTLQRVGRRLHRLPSRQQLMGRVAQRLEAAGGLEVVAPSLTPPAFRIASAAAALADRALVQQAER